MKHDACATLVFLVNNNAQEAAREDQMLHLMAFVGEQWHDSSHELLADAQQHHAHRFCQLLDAAADLQADFMVAVITTVLKNLGDLSSIWCNGLQEVPIRQSTSDLACFMLIRQSTSDLLRLMLVKASMQISKLRHNRCQSMLQQDKKRKVYASQRS